MCYECYAGKVKTQDHKNITMRIEVLNEQYID